MASDARLASGLWVAALLRLLSQAAVPAYVLARGDDTAGDIRLKSVLHGTVTLWERRWDLASGSRDWTSEAPLPEAEADARLGRARARDPDLWVIEIEAAPEALARLLRSVG